MRDFFLISPLPRVMYLPTGHVRRSLRKPEPKLRRLCDRVSPVLNDFNHSGKKQDNESSSF